jgi:D-beta-D-heptose 7-phosphate kinase/D-beta-D-heptose 1-phosphate adenosyltransferase
MTIDISKFKTCNVLVIGDLTLDEWISGSVDTIAPEAPVPVVNVESDTVTPGGSGNVARNLATLGANVSVVGVIGKGPSAWMLSEALTKLGIGNAGVQTDEKRKTPKRTRIMSGCQQLLQVDRGATTPVSSGTESAMIVSVIDSLSTADIVIVCDRDKGTLTRTFLTSIFSQAKTAGKPVIVDPAGAPLERYMGATWMITGTRTLSCEAGADLSTPSSILKAGTSVHKKTRTDGLLITCGRDGAVAFEKDRKPFIVDTKPRQVFDTAGVRDTMTAVMALSLATGGSFHDAATVAGVAAGILVGRSGSATLSEKEMILELMAFSGMAPTPPEKEKVSLTHRKIRF